MAKPKLSRQDAEEFTKHLNGMGVGTYGLVETAIHELGVPEALGMTAQDWVAERLKGLVALVRGGYFMLKTHNERQDGALIGPFATEEAAYAAVGLMGDSQGVIVVNMNYTEGAVGWIEEQRGYEEVR